MCYSCSVYLVSLPWYAKLGGSWSHTQLLMKENGRTLYRILFDTSVEYFILKFRRCLKKFICSLFACDRVCYICCAFIANDFEDCGPSKLIELRTWKLYTKTQTADYDFQRTDYWTSRRNLIYIDFRMQCRERRTWYKATFPPVLFIS
jgi:hypothetical protein